MGAYATAKELGREAVLEKIKSAGLMTYGLRREDFCEALKQAEEAAPVDAGLNNADTDGALLELLRENPGRIFEGIRIAGMLTGTEALSLYLPEKETALAEELGGTAETYGIEIINDIIDVRKSERHFLLHIVTAAELSDIREGTSEEGVYIKAEDKPLEKVRSDTKVSSLISLEGARAVSMGYHFFTPEEAADKTAADAVNAVIKVIREDQCIVRETLDKLSAFRRASCGKCVFCREGLIQLEYMQKEITAARGKAEYPGLTQEIGEAMGISTLCSVGQESAKAALDATAKFAGEYEAHIKKNKCPAGVCTSFSHIYVDPQACTGCGDCMDVCPADCIEGRPKYIHMIDEFDCTKCGKCIEACEEDAIVKTSGKLPKLPNILTKAGRFRKH